MGTVLPSFLPFEFANVFTVSFPPTVWYTGPVTTYSESEDGMALRIWFSNVPQTPPLKACRCGVLFVQ